MTLIISAITCVNATYNITYSFPPHHISSISLPSSSSPNSGNSPTSTLSALTKTPLFLPHWKYRSPDGTLPSFLPTGSSSVMPIQGAPGGPGREGMGPTKEMRPRLVGESVRRQREGEWRSVSWMVRMERERIRGWCGGCPLRALMWEKGLCRQRQFTKRGRRM